MIKVDDIVILKEMEEINFKSIEEQLSYMKHVDCKQLSIGTEYKVTLRFNKPLNSINNRICYQIALRDLKTNSKTILFPMTWFRNSVVDKTMKRNNKIKQILK